MKNFKEIVYKNLFEAKHNKMTEQENETPARFQVGTKVVYIGTSLVDYKGEHGKVMERDLPGPRVLVMFDHDGKEKSVSYKELETLEVKSKDPADYSAN